MAHDYYVREAAPKDRTYDCPQALLVITGPLENNVNDLL